MTPGSAGNRFPRMTLGRLSLAVLSGFTALAGAWLGSMDLILKHPGYGQREIIAATIITRRF